MMKIKRINAEDTWGIRLEVMWPNMPLDFVKMESDHEAFHYGLFIDDKLVSVVSLFVSGETAQFRKFATLSNYQGKGYGYALLNYILKSAEEIGVETVWCNARKTKSDFYKKFGMEKTNKHFVREGIEYVIMECKLHKRCKI